MFMLLLVTVCTGVSSCEKEDDADSTDIEKIIVGKWFLDGANEVDLNDTSADGFYMYYVFNPDGTGYSVYYNGSKDNFTYEIIDGKWLTVSEDFKGLCEIIAYTKDVIYIDSNGHHDYRYWKFAKKMKEE